MTALSFTARRHDFADTLVLRSASDAAADPLDALLAADQSDWVMLRLVACTGLATLLLGLAGSLVA
jgi:hypothetical protein